jgi:hypothetical protein
LPRGGQKRGLHAAIATEVAAEIAELIGEGEGVAELEVAVRRQALAVAARVLERYLNADTSDHVGPTAPCACGALARYAGRRTKRILTALGSLVLERAYDHCPTCGQGFFPRDRELGIEGCSLSPGVTRMVGLVGAATSFEEGGTLLRELAGVEIGAKRVERAAKQLGAKLAAIERAATRDTDEQASEFAQRALRESARRRFEKAHRRVVLGDGAPWIWNLAGEQFPGAIEIVDLFHAKQHLAELSASLWGPTHEVCPFWLPRRWAELEAGDIESLVAHLEIHAHHSEEARKAAAYFSQNKERMRYRAFKHAGLCTSTGVVEAACKHTIGTRLKRPGMHWSVPGANAIAALRCAVLSRRFDRFFLNHPRSVRTAA